MVGIAAACLSAFASAPVFPNFGVWFQSEPVITALFTGASICALGVAFFAYSTPEIARHALWHPMVVIPILVSLWSWVAPMPMGARTLPFFGTPQLGLGGAWFLSLGIMTAGARCLLSMPSQTRNSTWFVVTIIIITLCVVLSDFFVLDGWRPYNFSDYFAFHGLYLWIITACWRPHLTWLRWGGLLIGATIILTSRNLTGSIALFAAIFSYFAARYFLRHVTDITVRRMAAFGIVVLAILTPVGVYYAHHVGFPDFVSIDTVGTFKSRSLLLETVLHTIIQNPGSLLTGNGWGSLSEHIFTQIPLDQTAALSPPPALRQKIFFWDGLWLLHFHTHNELAEHLFSGGLPSLVLWLGYLAALPLTATKEKLPAAIGLSVGYVLISSMWFQMPGGLPLMAMAVAGLGREEARQFTAPLKYAKLTVVFSMLAGVILAASSIISFNYGTAAAKQVERNFIPSANSDPLLCGPDSPTLGASLAQFSELMKTFAMGNIDLLRKGKKLKAWRYERMDDFLCRADEIMAQDGPLSIGVRGLTMRSDFAFAPQPLASNVFEKRLYSGWDKNINWVLSRAPLRTDLAVPYLSWLLGQGDEPRALALSEHILSTNPNDPVGLWFSGVVLLNDMSKRYNALQRLKDALQNGLEKVMPIEPELKAKLIRP